MGKFNLKVEQNESRTASWNGLCSTFKGPLYVYVARLIYFLLKGISCLKSMASPQHKQFLTHQIHFHTKILNNFPVCYQQQ